MMLYFYNSDVDLQRKAPYVTANVNLWANPFALIANPGALADLTEEERGWVTAAAEAAAQQSTVGDADDARVVGELCAAGTRFAVASAADLSAMREAFAPVNATLAEDPETNGYINRITELKSATAPGPGLNIPADCTGTPLLERRVRPGAEHRRAAGRVERVERVGRQRERRGHGGEHT